MKNLILFIPFLFIVMACASTPMNEDIPAVIVDADDRSRNELKQIITTALNIEDINLADDALTDDSLLLIERTQYRNLNNAPVLGRDLGRPEIFRLVLSDDQCVLIHQRDNRRWVLRDTQCAPAK